MLRRISPVFALAILINHAAALSPIDVPISIPHGNAIARVVADSDRAFVPPQLVVVSVPFGKSVLAAKTPLTVYDAHDEPLPTETTVLSKWPDGSVRWAQVRWHSHRGGRQWADAPNRHIPNPPNLYLPWEYRVRAAEPPPPPSDRTVSVTQEGLKIVVNNGRIIVEIDPAAQGFGFSQVLLAEPAGPASGPLILGVDFEDGQTIRTSGVPAAQARVEESGPLRAVIFLKGRLGQTHEWQTRLFIHADEPAIRAEHTLGGLGHREIDSVERIFLSYETELSNRFRMRAAGQTIEFSDQVEPGEAVVLRQEAPRFKPPRDFAYELFIQQSESASHHRPRTLARGGRADGWLRAESDKLTVGIAMRYFSEKGPKAFRVASGGKCTIDLWPPGEVLKLSRARAITHQVLYSFYPTAQPPETDRHSTRLRYLANLDLPYRAYLRPIVPMVDTKYMCQTHAFGPYVPAETSKLRNYERVLIENFENWHARHYDSAAHYGMMHFGDYIASLGSDNGGNPERPHWRAHEWEFTSALFTHFVRRGDVRAIRSAMEAYRHFLDVDVHYTKGINSYHGYGDNAEMHERFLGQEWGHVVCSGLLDAYVLTGDRRALETARRTCDHMAEVFNSDEAIAAKFRRQRRAVSWPMLALIRMVEVTGDQKYLDVLRNVLDLMDRRRELWMRDGTWQSALMCAMLENHHRLTGDPLAKRLYLDKVNWWLDEFYDPEHSTFGQRPGGAKFAYGPDVVSSGSVLMLSAASFVYAYELTQDLDYLVVAYQMLQEGMKYEGELIRRDRLPIQRRGLQVGATRSDGKWFSLLNFYTNRLPTVFDSVDDQTFRKIKQAKPIYRQWRRFD